MKTLVFCNLVPNKWGAYEAYLEALGRTFAAAGDVLVVGFAGAPIPEAAERFRAASIRWHILEGWIAADGKVQPWGFCGPALRLLRHERPDVIALNYGNELPGLVVALVARLGCGVRARWVWVQHQQMRDPRPWACVISRIRLLTIGFHRFVALYAGGGESLRKRGIDAGRITVLENAISEHQPTRTPGWLHAELGIVSDTPLVVSTGSLISRKRVDMALRVFAQAVASRNTPALLVIVGDGPERTALEALAHTLGIADRVRFLGRRADVREIMAASGLLLHTASAEASAYAIIESMAAGIPALVTASGAAREQIANGETGFVVESADTAGLTQHLASMLTNAALRQRLGQAARARWRERYRLEDSVRQYHALYRKVAGGGRH
ncbi:MAG: glycosyltransferase family 4 protein [Verrucomicrobia bacterium]|nr:glycosyltransferase family 4 protein [Verrucomicrobiota bacterium]